MFQGTTADLSDSSDYQTIDYPNAQVHLRPQHDGRPRGRQRRRPGGGLPDRTGHAFIYDVATSTFLPDIVYPGSTTTTAYGIWYNGGTSYTICGGYSQHRVTGQ